MGGRIELPAPMSPPPLDVELPAIVEIGAGGNGVPYPPPCVVGGGP
jgi:hypothetical protein